MKNGISILSTAPLDMQLRDDAAVSGITLDIIPFINTVYLDTPELRERIQELSLQSLQIAVTSQHAVMAVAKLMNNQVPDWSFYCLGNKTKYAINQCFANINNEEHFPKMAGEADHAAALADIIVNRNVKNVVFFCGDKRMGFLPEILTNAGVDVNEIIVYTTTETPVQVAGTYDAILFFSPSGVSSFFNVNSVPPETVLCAIGNTTAAALRDYSNNKIVISDTPSKRQVFQDAVTELTRL
jgi:uroporphyrinogen-III synthase